MTLAGLSRAATITYGIAASCQTASGQTVSTNEKTLFSLFVFPLLSSRVTLSRNQNKLDLWKYHSLYPVGYRGETAIRLIQGSLRGDAPWLMEGVVQKCSWADPMFLILKVSTFPLLVFTGAAVVSLDFSSAGQLLLEWFSSLIWQKDKCDQLIIFFFFPQYGERNHFVRLASWMGSVQGLVQGQGVGVEPCGWWSGRGKGGGEEGGLGLTAGGY